MLRKPNGAHRRDQFQKSQMIARIRSSSVAAELSRRSTEIVVTNDDREMCRECRAALLRDDPSQEENLAIVSGRSTSSFHTCEVCGFDELG